MNSLLVLSITALISQVFAPRPNQQWGPPEQQWGPPEQNQWGGPPQSGWGPKPWPKPQDPCKCIPKSYETVEVSPSAETVITYNSVYSCESDSKVKEILYQKTTHNNKVTCNGILVKTNDEIYELVYPEPSYEPSNGGPWGEPSNGGPWGEPSYGGPPQKESATITNYTRIISSTNGNVNYLECGTIANGRCAGDNFSGIGIYQAKDPQGCCEGGNTGVIATYRSIEIKGKCASKCTLEKSDFAYAEPLTNEGLAEPNQ